MLILTARCADYRQVFVGGDIYFTDADCYSRMTRARICVEQPGTILRHHDFENYPVGTTPHTTAPFDYLIATLALGFRAFTRQPLDLAGAWVSPALAIATGGLLWWWLRRMQFRYRWPSLLLFALSPILVHGTELGRPDHQSLLLLLVATGICLQSISLRQSDRFLQVATGLVWGLAAWVSLYEPLILLLLIIIVLLSLGRGGQLVALSPGRAGVMAFAGMVLVALAVEQCLPSWRGLTDDQFVKNWMSTIGELQPISLTNGVWYHWVGWLLVVVPLLVWWRCRHWLGQQEQDPGEKMILILLGAGIGLTMWQARWSYFFALFFVMALPFLLQHLKSRSLVWLAFILAAVPLAKDWDERLWPNEALQAARAERTAEMIGLRQLALAMRSDQIRPFLAPWWLSPALAYWSGQPGVAGSSHEAIAGTLDSARFYVTTEPAEALRILESRQVSLVVAYDADRVAGNSGQLLGHQVAEHALCYVLDRAPALSPRFLVLEVQSPAGKLFQVANYR